MYCPKCGKKHNLDGGNFCSGCGFDMRPIIELLGDDQIDETMTVSSEVIGSTSAPVAPRVTFDNSPANGSAGVTFNNAPVSAPASVSVNNAPASAPSKVTFNNGQGGSAAGRMMASEIPSENPGFQMQARPDLLIKNERVMYQRVGQPLPPVIKDALYKVKCGFCSNVFTYYQSNTTIHRNYPGGYVDCPFCRNHLAHNKSLSIAEFDLNVRDYI